MKQQPLILDTENVKIHVENGAHVVRVKMEKGGWLLLQPLPGDLTGLIGALTVAIDVLAGKFWPVAVVSDSTPRRSTQAILIESNRPALTARP